MGTTTLIYELVGRDSASPAFKKAGDSAATADSKLAKLGKTAAVVGAAVAGGAAVVAVESVKMAVSFQASMEKIHTQAGATQGSVRSLTADVLKLAPATQQGPQQLADALYHLKSLGMDNASAMKALATASNLAAVGGASLEETATAIGAAWRSGIKGAQNFGQAASTVNAIIGAGNMRMSDFIDALGSGILPSARTFGVSLKSVGAALALMTDEGIPATDAATRLRMSLSLLGAPSAAAEKQLATIGLSGTKLANAMRGPDGIIGAIQLLKTHLDASGLSATEQAQVLSRAFGGGRSSSAILTLVNNLSVLQQKQAQINKTTGAYGGAVEAQRKTAQAQFAMLRSSLDTLGVKLGLALLPPLTSSVQFIDTKLLPAFAKVGTAFAGFIPVQTIENDWNQVLKIFGLGSKPKPKPVRLNASDLFDVSPGKQSVLTPDMLPKPPPPEVYKNAFAKFQPPNLTNVLPKSATSNMFSNIDWGAAIATAIRSAASSAQKIGAAVIDLLGAIDWEKLGGKLAFVLVPLAVSITDNLLNAMFSEAIHHPLDMLVFLSTIIPVGKAAGIILKLFGDIPLLGPLLKLFLGPIEKAGALMETAFGKILKKVFGPVLDRISPYFKDASGWLTSKGEEIVLGLLSGVEERFPKLASWIAGIQNKVVRLFASAGAWLFTKGVSIIAGLLDGIEERFPATTRWLRTIGSKVIGAVSGAATWLVSKGRSIISGLLNGIRAEMSGIASWVKKWVVDPVVNWVKHWFGIRSPSTVMAGIGGHLMGGLFKGMSGANLTGMVKRIFGSLPDALGSIVTKGLVSIAALPGKALSALGSVGGDILNLLGLGGGSASGGNASDQAIGKVLAAARGWTGANWTALVKLWNQESGWRWNALNPSSGAYGIPQSLPADKMASAGKDWKTNPWTQIRWGLSYIAGRYGSPLAAWGHEQAFNWYGHGGRFRAGQLIGVGDRGRELVQFDRPGRVFSPEQTQAIEGGSVTVNVNHVPGYSTPSDVKNAMGIASRQLRLARR